MERHILNTLQWAINPPTVDLFHQVVVANEGDNKEVACMAAYICETALYY